MSKNNLLISCFNDSCNPLILPVGFKWAETLLNNGKAKYKLTLLLHGNLIKYGLKSTIYELKFGQANPYELYLNELRRKHKVELVICQSDLESSGYTTINVCEFIKVTRFGINYIVEAHAKNKTVIYDSKLCA